jgi:two-component system, OmpR family, sensor histidine kinase BaeS
MPSRFKSVSFKLGLLFSAIFIVLLIILGGVLYGVFTNVLVDYIKHDLLTRGNNHARILDDNFDRVSINHVVEMEKGVITEVLIADSRQKIIAASKNPDEDMRNHLAGTGQNRGYILEENWREHQYIISVSVIGNDEGYVYMYYPTNILREIVFVMNVLVGVASAGIILLAFGIIGMLSRKLTSPLLSMKEATWKMALGKYRQEIPVKGEDEVAELGRSIQGLGEQLQYFEDSRNEFTAAVAHELRTPLTYIKGYSDILQKGMAKNPEEQTEYLTIINKEAQRISFMVNDLFEMTKLQVGRFELDINLADLNAVIEKVVLSLSPAAAKKGLEFVLRLDPHLPQIEMDAQRMEQVLYNLIENGIKYSHEGGITVQSFRKNNLIAVEIYDTGEGIPAADLPRVWDRFYRVDRSRARKTGGTGLGLYVVKQIIEAHGGGVQVQSSLKEGSKFTICLKALRGE